MKKTSAKYNMDARWACVHNYKMRQYILNASYQTFHKSGNSQISGAEMIFQCHSKKFDDSFSRLDTITRVSQNWQTDGQTLHDDLYCAMHNVAR